MTGLPSIDKKTVANANNINDDENISENDLSILGSIRPETTGLQPQSLNRTAIEFRNNNPGETTNHIIDRA